MFSSTHPRPPQPHHPHHPPQPHHDRQPHHDHQPHHDRHHSTPPPHDNACADNTWHPPQPTEGDRALLVTLLGSEQEAEALLQTLQTASPDMAAIGYLLLRVLEKTSSN